MVWNKKGPIKMTSFFNVVNYKFKNIAIETFGSFKKLTLSLHLSSKNLSQLCRGFQKVLFYVKNKDDDARENVRWFQYGKKKHF